MDKIREALEYIVDTQEWARKNGHYKTAWEECVDVAKKALALLSAPVASDAREDFGFVREYPEDSWDTEDDLTHLVRSIAWVDGTDAQGRLLYHHAKETAEALVERYAAERERKAREEEREACAERALKIKAEFESAGVDLPDETLAAAIKGAEDGSD